MTLTVRRSGNSLRSHNWLRFVVSQPTSNVQPASLSIAIKTLNKKGNRDRKDAGVDFNFVRVESCVVIDDFNANEVVPLANHGISLA